MGGLSMSDEIVRGVELFSSLPDSEVAFVANTLRLREINSDTLLLEEGQEGDRYFILVEGEVEIIKAFGTPDERLLAVRKAGSFIGEMSLLSEEGRHTASVRTRTPVQLLEMSHKDLNTLLHRQPDFAYQMMRRISRRLSESENLTINDLREKNLELTKAYQELKDAHDQIIEKEKMERELEVAREIQLSILPREFPPSSDLDFGACITPMTAVGGDFYDIIALDEERFGIAMGDVSDHGVPAALFMALMATLLRVEASRTTSPMEVMEAVNRHLLKMNEAGMFVTLLYGVLNPSKKTFRYARAGHELPIILDPRGKRLELERSSGQPLGLFPEPLLDEQTLELSKGSVLILYTDGLPDTSDAQGQVYGTQKLQDIVSSGLKSSAQEMCDQIWTSLREHQGETDPHDDVTLVVVKLV